MLAREHSNAVNLSQAVQIPGDDVGLDANGHASWSDELADDATLGRGDGERN